LNNLLGGEPVDTTKPRTGGSVAFDKDMFLKLLVTQLRYQNPAEPMDSASFMQQASQLASVEQMQAMVASQQDSASWQKSMAAAALVGKTITATDDAGVEVSGVVTRVDFAATGVSLLVGGEKVPFSYVTSVSP
jgi:flagellar basal-body rod modification protein FlgD